MIAPKIVSRVQPTGRDYSGRTSPDIIDAVPRLDGDTWRDEADEGIAGYDFEIVAGAPVCEECQCVCDSASNGPCRCGCPECGCDDLHVMYPEDGRITIAGALILVAVLLGVGMFAALTALGMPETPANHLWTVGNYR
jgi:hypothetical protein